MRLHFTIITAVATCIVSHALSVGAAASIDFKMGPPNDWHARQFATPSHEISLRHVGRRIKFKCDGSVSGFFDEDYANDADWKKFTEKGGALVRSNETVRQPAGLT